MKTILFFVNSYSPKMETFIYNYIKQASDSNKYKIAVLCHNFPDTKFSIYKQRYCCARKQRFEHAKTNKKHIFFLIIQTINVYKIIEIRKCNQKFKRVFAWLMY